MFHHPEQMSTIAQINMREISEEATRWRLATALLKAQQTTSKDRPNKLGALRAAASQLLHKLSLPARAAVVKHG